MTEWIFHSVVFVLETPVSEYRPDIPANRSKVFQLARDSAWTVVGKGT